MIYNIFDQAPEDELFPLCRELDIGVIARVPFDEGSLTGTLTKTMTWPDGDWRNGYFVPENLAASVDHADALKPLVPRGMTMTEHGAAVHFVECRRRRRHPGDAQAGPRANEHRDERRRSAGPPSAHGAARSSLGSYADGLVPVGRPAANASRPFFVI